MRYVFIILRIQNEQNCADCEHTTHLKQIDTSYIFQTILSYQYIHHKVVSTLPLRLLYFQLIGSYMGFPFNSVNLLLITQDGAKGFCFC